MIRLALWYYWLALSSTHTSFWPSITEVHGHSVSPPTHVTCCSSCLSSLFPITYFLWWRRFTVPVPKWLLSIIEVESGFTAREFFFFTRCSSFLNHVSRITSTPLHQAFEKKNKQIVTRNSMVRKVYCCPGEHYNQLYMRHMAHNFCFSNHTSMSRQVLLSKER